MTGARIWMVLAAWLWAGLAVDLTAPTDGWARGHGPRVPHMRVPHVKVPHVKVPRPPRPRRLRSVSVKRADGTMLHGYRDSYGTHLRGLDGKTVNCQSSGLGAADVNIACR
jgi:hypothetical protein